MLKLERSESSVPSLPPAWSLLMCLCPGQSAFSMICCSREPRTAGYQAFSLDSMLVSYLACKVHLRVRRRTCGSLARCPPSEGCRRCVITRQRQQVMAAIYSTTRSLVLLSFDRVACLSATASLHHAAIALCRSSCTSLLSPPQPFTLVLHTSVARLSPFLGLLRWIKAQSRCEEVCWRQKARLSCTTW